MITGSCRLSISPKLRSSSWNWATGRLDWPFELKGRVYPLPGLDLSIPLSHWSVAPYFYYAGEATDGARGVSVVIEFLHEPLRFILRGKTAGND